MGNALFTKLSRRNLCTHFCIVRIVSGMAKWQAMYTDVTNSGNPYNIKYISEIHIEDKMYATRRINIYRIRMLKYTGYLVFLIKAIITKFVNKRAYNK